MALRTLLFLRNCSKFTAIRCSHKSANAALSISVHKGQQTKNPKEYKTENNFTYLEDPDTFGTLSGRLTTLDDTFEDDGDIQEQKYIENSPMPSQKLSIKQYADLIKEYLKHKRLKEAIDVLEVKMLEEDRVKPDNYIYNILIGACADLGYTKKAFKLFNEMKRRGLKPTGDTYTCLFHACANSPWPTDGLKNAQHLRNLMIEKRIEPNLTNYNAMIKAFGRCGDITMSFKIVDEMISKKIKIRVHTFNHLLHACIADKSIGLRHAIVVWRKMLKMREKPNIYSFNLMLKCVKECDLGDIEELILSIQEQMPLQIASLQTNSQHIEIANSQVNEHSNTNLDVCNSNDDKSYSDRNYNSEIAPMIKNKQNISLELLNNNFNELKQETKHRLVPNLLSKVVNMKGVQSLQKVKSLQDKFAVIGGQDDFLREMEAYSVKPDIKIFTQMLFLIESTKEAENNLIDTMKSLDIKPDIDFYNMLIKKRCLRSDSEGAFEVKDIIEQECEYRKKRYPFSKKLRLKVDIMTYGVLALACRTKEDAEKLLNEMKEKQLRVNIEILGTLLRNGTAHNRFSYVYHIMNIVKNENVKVNDIFIKHLEAFNDKCINIIHQSEQDQNKYLESFINATKKFLSVYDNWLKEINVTEVLKQEHPWKQFRDNYPESVQRDIKIKAPKKFYKRKHRYIQYTPRL